VSRRINDQKTRNLYVSAQLLKERTCQFLQCFNREEAGTNVLRHSTSFSRLYAAFAYLVKQKGFSSVHVSEDANDWLS
jgi:hypothetical protein